MAKIFEFIGARFDVEKALELFGNKPPVKINPQDWKSFLPEKVEAPFVGLVNIDYEHARSLKCDLPVLVATLCCPDLQFFHLLIDGNHRTYHALYVSKVETIDAIVLDTFETEKIISGPLKVHLSKYNKKAPRS